MIEVHNIHKSFNGTKVLNGINGVFESGKTSLLLGASGTGKSVLLQCIVGLIKPDIGSITYDGKVFTNNKLDLRQEIRRKIGMLFQGGALFDSMTVEENVEFPLRMQSSMTREERRDRVNFCLKRVGLENAGKKMPSEISGGMKKRVGIARAIAPNAKYLFCDVKRFMNIMYFNHVFLVHSPWSTDHRINCYFLNFFRPEAIVHSP